MGIRKDYYLREVALVLAQVKGLFLYDAIVERKILPYQWIKPSIKVTPAELDSVGVRVMQTGDDKYSFTLGEADYTCNDLVEGWRSEALANLTSDDTKIAQLARECELSRQSLYRIINGKAEGLQYLFTLRGRNPLLFWEGKPLAVEYKRVRDSLVGRGLMEAVL